MFSHALGQSFRCSFDKSSYYFQIEGLLFSRLGEKKKEGRGGTMTTDSQKERNIKVLQTKFKFFGRSEGV